MEFHKYLKLDPKIFYRHLLILFLTNNALLFQ